MQGKHIALFCAGLALLASALAWAFSPVQAGRAEPAAFTSVGLTESVGCTTDVGPCPAHSIEVKADGSYVVEGGFCNDRRKCLGHLTPAEMVSLSRALQTVGAGWVESPRTESCRVVSRQMSEDGWSSIDLEANGSKRFWRVNARTGETCMDGDKAVQLRHLFSALEVILKHEHRSDPVALLGYCYAKVPSKEIAVKPDWFRIAVQLEIGKDGVVRKASLYRGSGNPKVDSVALGTAKACSFSPATEDGDPIVSTVLVSYTWQTRDAFPASSNGTRFLTVGFPELVEQVPENRLGGRR